MKKLTSILTSALILSSMGAVAASAEDYIKLTEDEWGRAAQCDIDGDGRVSVADANYVLTYYADKSSSLGADEVKWSIPDDIRERVELYGNVSRSLDKSEGLIDAQDAALILSYVEQNAPKGDVNEDGLTDAVDASIVLSYYADSSVQVLNSAGFDEEVKALQAEVLGDVNGDGLTDASDASAILAIYADSASG